MRRHRKRNHPQHELWQIVYLDFITTVMIFFFAMWAVAKVQAKSKSVADLNTMSKVIELKDTDDNSFFASGSTNLTPWGGVVVDGVVDKLGENFVINETDDEDLWPILLIEGHTDDAGSKDQNIKFGFERAKSVSYRLQERLKRFNNNKLLDKVAICSFADNFPSVQITPDMKKGGISPDEIKKRRAKNRRIVLREIFLEKPKKSGSSGAGAIP